MSGRFGLFLALAVMLSACVDRGVTAIMPSALGIGSIHDVHIATLRRPSGNGWFGRERADGLSFTTLQISVPPEHKRGVIKSGFAKPDPMQDFTVAGRQDAANEAGFIANLRKKLLSLPPRDREITLYVHGYNNSFLEGVYRSAQMMHDFKLPGIAVHYSWPSAANPLGYTYDRDSVLFARDGLERLLRDLHGAGARKIVLVGHSLGTMLVMETLRQIEIRETGWTKRALGGVVLIAPDLDVDVFRSQADRFAALPEPFAIFVNARDRALQLSARINGAAARLGNLTDAKELGAYPVTVVDVSAFADGAGARHFTLGTSPILIQLLGQSADLSAAFQRDRAGRSGLLPGTVISVQNATQLILSPHLIAQN